MAETKNEEVIEIPRGHNDPIIEHPHMIVRGENVLSCNMAIQDIPKAIEAKKATCPKCGTVFAVRREQ